MMVAEKRIRCYHPLSGKWFGGAVAASNVTRGVIGEPGGSPLGTSTYSGPCGGSDEGLSE